MLQSVYIMLQSLYDMLQRVYATKCVSLCYKVGVIMLQTVYATKCVCHYATKSVSLCYKVCTLGYKVCMLQSVYVMLQSVCQHIMLQRQHHNRSVMPLDVLGRTRTTLMHLMSLSLAERSG